MLTTQVAASIGADLAAVGIDLDFAPVADVNTNPMNPIIGIRSFGADPELVARHVAAYVSGLQSQGVAACAKHFPGHGDTETDSHLELPVVHHDLDTFVRTALPPFRAAIAAGVASIMTAHIVVPALDDRPATTSSIVLQDLLRSELGFDGMVMTDALEMRAISATMGIEEGAVRALRSGADALCLGHDLADDALVSIQDAIVAAVRDGGLSEARLVEAAARVRGTAEWVAEQREPADVESGVGALAARRALQVDGDPALPARRSSSTSSRVRASPPARRPARASGFGERCPSPRSCASEKASDRRSRSSTASSSSSWCATRTGTRGSRRP